MARTLVKQFNIENIEDNLTTLGNDFTAQQPNFNKVGDVISSMLTEVEFQTERDGTWVLMDGRDVTGSDYATIKGVTTIPDARGRYLRNAGWAGMNLGDEQEATRVISIAENGGGANDIYATRNRSILPEDYDPDPTGSYAEEGIEVTGRFVISPGVEGSNNRRGVLRTRPRSLVLNYFIKINN